MDNNPESNHSRELIERIEKLEAKNAALTAMCDNILKQVKTNADKNFDNFTRIYDLVWPLVNKVFPRFSRTKRYMDLIVPSFPADPSLDRNINPVSIKADMEFMSSEIKPEEMEPYASRVSKVIIPIREESRENDELACDMLRGIILHVFTAPHFMDDERNMVTVRKLVLRGEWQIFEAIQERGYAKEIIDPPHLLLWRSMERNLSIGGRVANIGARFHNIMKANQGYEDILKSVELNTEFLDIRL